eukprot:m.98749 g.98749  ORF g.98749 m.98749 type:complete len:66 (-) comp13645_c2_seq1:1823-2020(-)
MNFNNADNYLVLKEFIYSNVCCVIQSLIKCLVIDCYSSFFSPGFFSSRFLSSEFSSSSSSSVKAI